MENVSVKDQSQSRDRLPYGVVVFLATLFTCLAANAITLSAQSGLFTTWETLPGLPSGATHIIDADGDNVWVEDGEGNLFTLALRCGEDSHCPEWQRVNDLAEIQPVQCHPTKRGANCTSLKGSSSPSPLSGEVSECIVANGCFPDPEYGYETYFALLSDGTVKYWQHGSGILGFVFNFVLSSVILPFIVAVIISIIFLVRHVAKRNKAG